MWNDMYVIDYACVYTVSSEIAPCLPEVNADFVGRGRSSSVFRVDPLLFGFSGSADKDFQFQSHVFLHANVGF